LLRDVVAAVAGDDEQEQLQTSVVRATTGWMGRH
jgi:hypothetical protein